ncbi:MAG: beta-propeller fold lactonase family protein [Phycisphaerales bacterium]|nr:beta-propeller fold lactonase family protein [Phycisphaerales bacterium]
MNMRAFLASAGLIGASAATALLIGGCPPAGNGNNNEEAGPVGPTRSTTIALTTDDQTLAVVNRETNSVSFFAVRDADGNDSTTLLAEVPVGQEPRFVALKNDDSEAYVTNTVSGTVSVISLTGDTAFDVVAEIAVGTEPRGCALTPNGSRLYVCNHTAGTVSVIDTAARNVIDTVNVGGKPQAIAITNDGDDDDQDETVYVTQFYAEVIPGGPGEAFDDGKQGVVRAFQTGNPAGTLAKITLAPIANSGFTSDRKNFCQQINAAAANNTYCPDTTITDGNNDILDADPQAVFPNQLHAALIRGNRLFLPNTGAQPEPPIRFNTNVQALVGVVDTATNTEVAAETANINAQIKDETQPAAAVANTVLDRLFGNDLVAIDADANGDNFLLVSRGGNYVIRAARAAGSALNIGAQADAALADNVVRFQTGNIPNGVVMSSDGTRGYVNNEVGVSVTVLNLQNNTVLNRDVESSTVPEPGTFAHGVLVGKLVFFSALGTDDNGIFGTPIRDIVPLASRGKMSDNGWSSCASCHPDGLADGVTWIFATGPRQTISLDGFFAKDSPADQRVSNWNAVRSSVTDFNENSVAVQGGIGFAGNPASAIVHNHGVSAGASDALDAQTLWVQTIRAPIQPPPASLAAATNGRALFDTNCASCHGGPKWTKSTIFYADNPAFDGNPLAGGVARDPGLLVLGGGQLSLYQSQGFTLVYLNAVGTFNAANAIEIRNNATGALGAAGFNAPSLLGVGYSAPYLHDGSAITLDNVFASHTINGVAISTLLNAAQLAELKAFLETIDGSTVPLRSEADTFRDAISP